MTLEPGGSAGLDGAKAALAAGRATDAIQICEQILAADRTDFDAWELLGVARARAGLGTQAVDAMRECVRLRPNIPRPHFNLANALVATGSPEAAREELELCLSLDPAYTKASQMLRQLEGSQQGAHPPGIASGPAPGITAPGITSPFGVPGVGSGSTTAGPLIGQAPPSLAGASQPAPLIGQAPPAAPSPPFGAAPQFGAAPPPAFTPSFAPGSAPPPFTPGPAQGAAASAAKPRLQGNSYGIQVQHELDDRVVHWLKRAIWLGGGLTLVSLLSLLGGSHGEGSGPSAGQVALAILQIVVGAGLLTGAVAVLNRKDWGRKLVQVFGAMGFIIAAVALILMLTSGPPDVADGSAAVLGTRSIIRPVLWMFCCGFLFIQMNSEFVRLAMDRPE